MAATIRFERMKCRGQIPVPYHLAMSQCQADIKLSKKDKRKKKLTAEFWFLGFRGGATSENLYHL